MSQRWRSFVVTGDKRVDFPRGACQGITKAGWAWYVRLPGIDRKPVVVDGMHLLAGSSGTENWDEVEHHVVTLRRDQKRSPAERDVAARKSAQTLKSVLGHMFRHAEQGSRGEDQLHRNTIDGIYKALDRLTGFFGETCDVTLLTRAKLQLYVDARTKEVVRRKTLTRKGTALRELAILRRSMSMAGIVLPQTVWPTQGGKKPSKVEGQRAKFRTMEVAELLIQGLRRHGDDWIADLCIFVIQTGLRWGELTRVRASWVVRTQAGTFLRMPPGSTKEEREHPTNIRLTSAALAVVDKVIARSYSMETVRGGRPRKEWPKDADLLWGPRVVVYRQVAGVCRREGIAPDISLRDLRATFGMNTYRQGGIYAAMHALRHADITTTQRYLGLSVEDEDNTHAHHEALGQRLVQTL